MRLDRFLQHVQKREFHAAGENLGDELPRNRLWLLRQARMELEKMFSNYGPISFNDEYARGYKEAMQDIMAAYDISIENKIRKEIENMENENNK